MLRQGPDRPAVGKRLTDREVEPVPALLHGRPVERAGAAAGVDAPAGGALPGGTLNAVLEEQQLDPPVRGGFEGLTPPRGGAPVAPRLLTPALDRLVLLLAAPALEQRLDLAEQLRGRRVRVGRRPADHRLLHLIR